MTENKLPPPGWRIVPIEPTEDMRVYGLQALVIAIERFMDKKPGEHLSDFEMGAVMRNSVELTAAWKAMLNAAPSPEITHEQA